MEEEKTDIDVLNEDGDEEVDINLFEKKDDEEIIKEETDFFDWFSGKLKIDKLVLLMNIVGMVIVSLIFYKLQLFKIPGKKGRTIKLLYIISILFLTGEIITTKPEVTSVSIEYNMLVFQVENLLALFTPIIILFLGTLYLLPDLFKKERYNIMIIIIMLFLLAIVVGHGETDNRNVRIVRLFKQTLFTIGIILLLVYLSLLHTYKIKY